ncbi:hypothetical protein D3C72_1937630 [compost metagenome]
MASTLLTMISKAVTGMTRRCSIVPCSRSRMRAAPVRMIDSMVMFMMMLLIAPNQTLFSCGLKRARMVRLTGRSTVLR